MHPHGFLVRLDQLVADLDGQLKVEARRLACEHDLVQIDRLPGGQLDGGVICGLLPIAEAPDGGAERLAEAVEGGTYTTTFRLP